VVLVPLAPESAEEGERRWRDLAAVIEWLVTIGSMDS
jgi:hypothetical protein